MSQTPDLPEEGHQHLRRALHQLPTHEPSADTWQRIEAQLATENAIQRTLPYLPAHTPDDAVWTAIAGRLSELELAPNPLLAESPTPGVVRTLWPVRPWSLVAGMAAAILVLLLAWWQRPTSYDASTPQETITYTEETMDSPAAPLPSQFVTDPLERQGLAFIEAHCTSLPTVCQSGEFRELRTQLTELESEEQSLQQAARRFGTNPELVRHPTQVTTLKAAVTRELIHLLIS